MVSGVGTAMLGLAIALAVTGAMGTVLDAGLVLGVHAIALAAGAPVGGRLSDRWGPRPVLIATALLQAGGGAWLVTAVATAAPTPVLGFAAAAVGLANPPSSSVTRSHWPALVETAQLRSAYAVDSALTSATVVAGPPLAALASHAASPTAAIVGTLAAKVLGALLLSTTSGLATASARRADGRLRAWFGPLATGRTQIVLVVLMLDTFGYGCLGIAAVASGDGTVAGMLMAGLAVGEIIGGLASGARAWPATARTQLVTMHAVAVVLFAATATAAGTSTTPVLLVGCYLAVGVTSGARDALSQVALNDAAPPRYRVESFAWLSAFMWSGFAVGSAIAGHVQVDLGTPAVHVVAAGASAIAAVGALGIARARTSPAGSAIRAA